MNRRWILMAAWLSAPYALAQLPPGLAEPELPTVNLGRLFNSAEARAAIDGQRSGRPASDSSAPAAATVTSASSEAVAAPVAVPTVLDGVLRRSSGKSTIWLNQQPQNDENNHLLNSGALSLRTNNGRRVILKPGQSFDANNGIVTEAVPSQ